MHTFVNLESIILPIIKIKNTCAYRIWRSIKLNKNKKQFYCKILYENSLTKKLFLDQKYKVLLLNF